MNIFFWIMFVIVIVIAIYFKIKLNKAYDCICYLTGKQNKKRQKNRALILKLKDLVDDYRHDGNVFTIMPQISDTIIKIELDTDQSN